MFDIISGILGLTYDAETWSTLDELIVSISGAIIVIVFVWLLDSISHFIINFGRKGGR